MTSKDRPRGWLPRATTQFARTVYTELRRAGHAKSDIVRFINELMDLLTEDAEHAAPEPINPEAGLPGSNTMNDVLDFELRIRGKDRRQDERLVVAAIDVVLPSWTSSSARQRSHEVLYDAVSRSLRVGDSFGQLGPDRYLLILPRSKDTVRTSIEQRISQAMNRATDLADGLVLEVRWAAAGAGAQDAVSAADVLQACFASSPVTLTPALGDHVITAARTVKTNDVERPPAREIVLALGGGAARAVSHAGVLHVLRAAGIRPIAVAGCSAGALLGAMFARGIEPDAIIARFTEFSTTSIYLEMRRAYASFLRQARAMPGRSRTRYFGASSLAFYSDSTLSVLPGDLLSGFVEHFVGSDCDIAGLPVPFSVVATDLVEGRSITLSHGSLHAALAASCAVPGLFPPQQTGERLLVDGSTVTEVPIWTAQLFGLSAPVLAIHMGRPFHRVTDYQTSTEVSARSNALIHAELVREQLRRADLLLTIPMEEIGWLDFRQAKRIVEIGRRAAEESLPRILARLDRPRVAVEP